MTKKILAIVLGLSAWIGGTVAASVGQTGTAAAQPLFKIERAHADYTPTLDGSEPIFVLLLGSDSRPGEPMNRGRSDSIHILGINPAAHRATVFGIPRDSWVNLSTGGTNKINSAMPVGGPEATVATVEALTGITFDYYVLTGFDEVTHAVNQIGGLVVDVPYTVVGDRPDVPRGSAAHDRLAGARLFAHPPLAAARRLRPLDEPGRRPDERAVAVPRRVREGRRAACTRGSAPACATPRRPVSIDELIKLAGLSQALPATKVTNLVAIGSSATVGTQSIVNLSDENAALWQDMAQDGYLLQKDIPAAAQPDPT